MIQSKKGCLLVKLIGMSIVFLFCMGAQAEFVRAVETDATINFHGKYESELEPSPHPPGGSETIPPSEEVQKPVKPGGLLPQTGHLLEKQLFWFGISFILLVLIVWKKKQHSMIFKNNYNFS